MEYFLLKQDERYTNTPFLLDVVKKINTRDINQLNAHKIPDITILYMKSDTQTCYLDILDRQLYIISEELKKILEKYEPDTIFKLLPLIDITHQRQENYFLPIFEEIDALSPNCQFNLDKSVIKKLILQAEKIKGKKIFKIRQSAKPLVVVRLDTAESILRRNFKGILLEKIPVE